VGWDVGEMVGVEHARFSPEVKAAVRLAIGACLALKRAFRVDALRVIAAVVEPSSTLVDVHHNHRQLNARRTSRVSDCASHGVATGLVHGLTFTAHLCD
jgi:hypothetical protein